LELLRHRIALGRRADVFKLYPISDTHLCSPEADAAAVARTVELVRSDPNAYWGHGGDITDCILPGDPRWNLRAIDLRDLPRDERGRAMVDDLANWQVDVADEMFWPIAHKCLWLQEGNHEQAMYRHYHTHLVYQLLKRWKARGVEVPYGGQTAFVRLDLTHGHETTTKYVFTEHGATGGGTNGNGVNNFEGRLKGMGADIYLKGHIHKRMIWHSEYLSWGARKITRTNRVMALTGAYLKSYGTGGTPAYAERAAYAPVTIGGVVVLVKPSTGQVEAMNIEALNLASGKAS
jgi:hypothetical protein